jgi:hypothetical protein
VSGSAMTIPGDQVSNIWIVTYTTLDSYTPVASDGGGPSLG